MQILGFRASASEHSRADRHGAINFVGTSAGSNGNGYASASYAYDIPGTGSHLVAVYGYQAAAANYAGFFDGKVYSSVSFTTSDRRLKSDFKPVDSNESAALLALTIQTFKKHQNGINLDKANGENVARLKVEIAARKDKTGPTADDLKFIADNQAYCDKWDAEDWLPMLGDAMPGRLAGVIAQDVHAINPDYVEVHHDGTLTINDATVLYQMVAAIKAEIAAIKAAAKI